VNRNACGTSIEYLRDGINTVFGRIETTNTCLLLSEDEKMNLCGEDYQNYGDALCWMAHLTATKTEVFVGACGPESREVRQSEPESDSGDGASDWRDSSNYSRSDGCGFDQYGRWRCY